METRMRRYIFEIIFMGGGRIIHKKRNGSAYFTKITGI